MNPSMSDKVADGEIKAQLDAELIARLDRSRQDLMEAASVLQKPLHTVQRAEDVMRTVLPIVPYAVAAITVLGVASSLLSGRRVRPVLLIATGLDVWRLWKSYKMMASMPSPPGTPARPRNSRPVAAPSRVTGHP